MSLNCRDCEEVNKYILNCNDWNLCPACDKEIEEFFESFPPMKPRYIADIMENYDH